MEGFCISVMEVEDAIVEIFDVCGYERVCFFLSRSGEGLMYLVLRSSDV